MTSKVCVADTKSINLTVGDEGSPTVIGRKIVDEMASLAADSGNQHGREIAQMLRSLHAENEALRVSVDRVADENAALRSARFDRDRVVAQAALDKAKEQSVGWHESTAEYFERLGDRVSESTKPHVRHRIFAKQHRDLIDDIDVEELISSIDVGASPDVGVHVGSVVTDSFEKGPQS